jgi:hypothetical protein
MINWRSSKNADRSVGPACPHTYMASMRPCRRVYAKAARLCRFGLLMEGRLCLPPAASTLRYAGKSGRGNRNVRGCRYPEIGTICELAGLPRYVSNHVHLAAAGIPTRSRGCPGAVYGPDLVADASSARMTPLLPPHSRQCNCWHFEEGVETGCWAIRLGGTTAGRRFL